MDQWLIVSHTEQTPLDSDTVQDRTSGAKGANFSRDRSWKWENASTVTVSVIDFAAFTITISERLSKLEQESNMIRGLQ